MPTYVVLANWTDQGIASLQPRGVREDPREGGWSGLTPPARADVLVGPGDLHQDIGQRPSGRVSA